MIEQIQDDDCPDCNGKGYFIDEYLSHSFDCTSCAGTGIRDFAANLPPTSLDSVIAELRLSAEMEN